MKTFTYHRAVTLDDAVGRAAGGARYYAGGTNLLDLMKTGVENPDSLVDVGSLDLDSLHATESGGLHIGSGLSNSAVANDPLVRTSYPMLSQAILSGATTQIRNMATVGGNLMQRTRCPYFMDPELSVCNKRDPGSGCGAATGVHREHAIFGTAPGRHTCIAVHPSDMAVALAALDAVVHVTGPAGSRSIPIGDFFALPADQPQRDTTVAPGELITAVELPPSTFGERGWYLKVRDRHSYAFALVSVAAGLDIVDGVIRSAAVALGGVAAKPWRVPAAEAQLVGAAPGPEAFAAAARTAVAGAEPLSQNAFKVTLAHNSVIRALTRAAARA